MKRILSVACCCITATAYAQPGINEMQQAQQDLTSTFLSAFDCCMVLAGIFGLFGGLRVYHNWQLGKERIDAAVAAWFFAALFMILSGPFLRALFGI